MLSIRTQTDGKSFVVMKPDVVEMGRIRFYEQCTKPTILSKATSPDVENITNPVRMYADSLLSPSIVGLSYGGSYLSDDLSNHIHLDGVYLDHLWQFRLAAAGSALRSRYTDRQFRQIQNEIIMYVERLRRFYNEKYVQALYKILVAEWLLQYAAGEELTTEVYNYHRPYLDRIRDAHYIDPALQPAIVFPAAGGMYLPDVSHLIETANYPKIHGFLRRYATSRDAFIARQVHALLTEAQADISDELPAAFDLTLVGDLGLAKASTLTLQHVTVDPLSPTSISTATSLDSLLRIGWDVYYPPQLRRLAAEPFIGYGLSIATPEPRDVTLRIPRVGAAIVTGGRFPRISPLVAGETRAALPDIFSPDVNVVITSADDMYVENTTLTTSEVPLGEAYTISGGYGDRQDVEIRRYKEMMDVTTGVNDELVRGYVNNANTARLMSEGFLVVWHEVKEKKYAIVQDKISTAEQLDIVFADVDQAYEVFAPEFRVEGKV